ncbi:MAG TPA: hypothetical protein VM580_03210 [Labilithrix sp.]|nr:hypothetical protein [Labilithrix sp.]
MANSCQPQRILLAEGPFCKVEHCECGTVHFSLGPITLRLRVDVVESIWVTLGEALMRSSSPNGRRTNAVTNEHLS